MLFTRHYQSKPNHRITKQKIGSEVHAVIAWQIAEVSYQTFNSEYLRKVGVSLRFTHRSGKFYRSQNISKSERAPQFSSTLRFRLLAVCRAFYELPKLHTNAALLLRIKQWSLFNFVLPLIFLDYYFSSPSLKLLPKRITLVSLFISFASWVSVHCSLFVRQVRCDRQIHQEGKAKKETSS